MPEPEQLSESDCRMLLSTGAVGRVGLCTSEGPVVLPVNYAVVDETVVLRTTMVGILGSIDEGQPLAFEADHLDYAYQHGWSVLVRGTAHVLSEGEQEHVRRVCEPRAWASARSRHIALQGAWLSGRRLGTGWSLLGDLPVRRRPPCRPG